ncbi:MAG: TraR/DksA C4-type zinc finger protein [Gemmataceae bacterium]|nr:TraR/DksA C4-type zinc finger protein [Gemmataceae bacterium]
MNEQQLAGFKGQLFALAERINGDVSSLTGEALRKTGGEASGNLSNTPLHLADLGTDAFEQQLTMNLLENETGALAEIAAALERIDRGTFGHCEVCGATIPRERLETVPYVRHCIGCARQLQGDANQPPQTTGL